MKISNDVIPQIYLLAKQIHEAQCDKKTAIDSINKLQLMNDNSASIYFSIFHNLMNGVPHKRAMNEFSTRYFLENIYSDFGKQKFLLALQSTEGHVTYYNSLGKGKRKSISKLLEEVKDKYKIDNNFLSIFPDEIDKDEHYEGQRIRVLINHYERDIDARNVCIEHYGLSCSVCGLNFEDVYGELGIGFIHVHHLIEISTIGVAYKVDPINDLRPVCPNCHAMLHRKKPAYTIQELKNHLTKS